MSDSKIEQLDEELTSSSDEEKQTRIKGKVQKKKIKKNSTTKYMKIFGGVFISLFCIGIFSLTPALKYKTNFKFILKSSNPSLANTLSQSKTIQTENQLKLLISGLSNTERFKGKNINDLNFDLLFRATNDGFFQSRFHSKVDDINCTLIIVKTKKGRIFGGFTTKLWNEGEFASDDNNAFGFSFETMKIYPIINGKYAIYKKNTEPEFIGIFSFNYLIIDKGYTYGLGYSYSGLTKKYEVNGGEYQFEAEEIEVFHISEKK